MKNSAVATLVLLLLAAPVRAQALDASRPVKSSVEAVAAEVEVLVLDSKGVPVEGLTKDDFHLFVNGKEMPLDWFEAPPAPGASATASVPAPSAADAAPSETPSTPSRRTHSTVFVISALHVDAGAQRQASMLSARTRTACRMARRLPSISSTTALAAWSAFTTRPQGSEESARPAATNAPDVVRLRSANRRMGRPSRQMLRNLGTVLDGLASRPEPKTVVAPHGPDLSAVGIVTPDRKRCLPEETPGRSRSEDVGQSHLRDRHRHALQQPGRVARRAPVDVPAGSQGHREPGLPRARHDRRPRPERHRRDRPDRPTSKMPDDRPLLEAGDSWEFRNDTFASIAKATGGARLGFSNKPAELILDASRLLAKRYRLGFTPPDATSARRDIRVEMSRARSRRAHGERPTLTDGRDRGARALRGTPPLGGSSEGGLHDRRRDEVPDFRSARTTRSPSTSSCPSPASTPRSGERAGGRSWSSSSPRVDDEGRASEPMVIPFAVELAKATAVDGAFFRKDSTFSVDKRWKGRLFVGVRDTATNRLGAVAVPIGG